MSLFNNGLSGLAAAQHVLNATSQNIANANTPGYSRQEAVLASRVDSSPSRLTPGNGVEVTELRRIADDYRVAGLWRATSQAGFDDQMQTLVMQAEDIIGGSELSVSTGIDSLFAAFNAAAEAPQSTATRQQILATAGSLAHRFNQLAGNLGVQARQVDEQSAALVASINSQTGSIGRLNEKISEVLAKGGNTSQLEDQRDLAVQALANSLDIRSQRMPDGRLNITLTSGQPLVLGNKASAVTLVGDELKLELKGQDFPITHSGGQLGALQGYKHGTLAGLQASLDQQAANLAASLNDRLMAGFDLNGNPGAALYQFDPADPAASLRLSAGIQPDHLGFIVDDGTGNPAAGSGDNRNLLQVISLKAGFYDDYTGLLGGLAIESAQIQAETNASKGLLTDAQSRRDSISGVNEDEEAVRLMEFTRAYQANAKVINTAGQLFDTLLGMF